MTGSPAGFKHTRQFLCLRGTLVLKSTYHGLPQVNLTTVVVDEVTVVGSHCGSFETALRLLVQQRVDVCSIIHARYPLEQGELTFEHTQRAGVLKVQLTMDGR